MSTESRQARRWRERRTATRWPTTPFVLLGRMEDPGGAGAWAITGWRRRTRVMPPPACSKPGWRDAYRRTGSTGHSRPVRIRWESRWSGSLDQMPGDPGATSGGRVMKPGPFAESTGEVDATGTASACLGDEAIATWTRDDILAELRATATLLGSGDTRISIAS